MSGMRWTEEEDELLRKWWPTNKKLAALVDIFPDRTPDSMAARAERLGLGNRKNVPRGGGSWLRIKAELEKGPKTALEISKKIHMKRDKILEILRNHRLETYVYDWTEPGNGGRSRIFALGHRKADKPKPPTLSRAKINTSYRQRLKTEHPEKYDMTLARNALRKREARRETKPDLAASWLFNPTTC